MTENHTRAFRGIWIGATIWLNKELTIMEKVLCAEIDSLSNPDCTASNAYLAEMFDSTPGSIAAMLSKLRGRGFVLDNEHAPEGKRILRLAPGFNKRLREGLTDVKSPTLTPVKQREKKEEHSKKKVSGGRNLAIVTQEDIAAIVFPAPLNHGSFNAAAQRWRTHKARRGESFTKYGMELLIKQCAEMGLERAIAAIDFTISRNWQGVREEYKRGNTVGSKTVDREQGTHTGNRDTFTQINQAGLARDMQQEENEKGEFEE